MPSRHSLRFEDWRVSWSFEERLSFRWKKNPNVEEGKRQDLTPRVYSSKNACVQTTCCESVEYFRSSNTSLHISDENVKT